MTATLQRPGTGQGNEHPGQSLRRARDRAGMSMADLARATGLTESAIYRIEAGKRTPQRRTRKLIATALDVDVDAVFGSGTVPPPPSAITWPPADDPLVAAVQAYRAAGDATGAGELLHTNQEVIRQRLNKAGAAPRPRGGSNRDGIESLGSWARKLGVPIADAVQAAQRGEVPGAFVQQLDCPVIGCRWAVKATKGDA